MCKNHAQTLKVIVAAICKQQLDFLHTNTACNWRVQIRTVICKGRFPTSRRSKEILLLITCLGSPNESNYLLQVLHFSRKVRGSIYNQMHSVNNRIFSILDFGICFNVIFRLKKLFLNILFNKVVKINNFRHFDLMFVNHL